MIKPRRGKLLIEIKKISIKLRRSGLNIRKTGRSDGTFRKTVKRNLLTVSLYETLKK